MKVILFVILIFLSSGVFAISGVNPRSYEVDFIPNYEGEFNFNFVLDKASKVDLYVEGDLAKYVSLDKERISGRESVVALLRLPSEINSPGVNQIRIVAWNVVSVIKVNVPYPEKYVELRLSAPNVNVGETVDVNLEVSSKGYSSVEVEPRIEIYKVGDWESGSLGRELVETIEIDSDEVAVNESKVFKQLLNCSNYFMGDYLAVAVVDYGERTARVENSFKVGALLVRVLNYTREFKENKILKFEIEVESLWNSNIDDLYAEVNIVGFEDAGFVSPIVGLQKWGKTTLVGFLDTGEISDFEIEAEIILRYKGEISSEVVDLKILKGLDYVFYAVLTGCLIVFGFLIWRGKNFIERYRKLRA